MKRILRKDMVTRLLEQACDLVGQNCSLAVLAGDALLATSGTGIPDPKDGNAISHPVSFGNGHEGVILMQSGANPSMRGILPLLATSLHLLGEQEIARRSIADEALSKYRELALLHRSIPRFNTSLRLHDVVRDLLNDCRRDSLPGEMGAIFLCDPETNNFHAAGFFGFASPDQLDELCASTIFQQSAELHRSEIINDLASDPRWTKDIPGLRSILLAPVVSPNRCEGMLALASDCPEVFEAAHQKYISTISSVAGISISNAFHFEETRVLMDAMLQALAEAIDSRDPYTAGHSKRVAQLAAAFAVLLNEDVEEFPDLHFTETEIIELYYAGILHDVGKIGIREEVLTKDSRLPTKTLEIIRTRMELLAMAEEFDCEGHFERIRRLNRAMTPTNEELAHVRELCERKLSVNGHTLPILHASEAACLLLPYGNLTPEERREIERHPAESQRILQHIPAGLRFGKLLTIIRQHHERLDGSGYPDGLVGNDILTQSRIVAIVDIYDAVTQERHYKPARTREEALDILNAETSAGKLDPRLVGYFSKHLETLEREADRYQTGRPSYAGRGHPLA